MAIYTQFIEQNVDPSLHGVKYLYSTEHMVCEEQRMGLKSSYFGGLGLESRASWLLRQIPRQ